LAGPQARVGGNVMNPNEPAICNGHASAPDEAPEVVRILDGYLSAVQGGRPADPERLLAEYPALAHELRACLGGMKLAGQLAKGSAPGLEFGDYSPLAEAIPVPPEQAPFPRWDFNRARSSRIVLRDLPEGTDPALWPGSAAMSREGSDLGRYQVFGEI